VQEAVSSDRIRYPECGVQVLSPLIPKRFVTRDSVCGLVTRIVARIPKYRGLILGICKIFFYSARRPPRQPVISMISFQCLTGVIVQLIKSRRMKCAVYVACMGKGRDLYKDYFGDLKERDHLGDSGVDGWVILTF
jgi:hypothetical protein